MGSAPGKRGPAQSPLHQPKHNVGDTHALRHRLPKPQLPHERDESSDSQEQPTTDARVEHAASDVKKALVDTGRAPRIDEVAREALSVQAGRRETRRR